MAIYLPMLGVLERFKAKQKKRKRRKYALRKWDQLPESKQWKRDDHDDSVRELIAIRFTNEISLLQGTLFEATKLPLDKWLVAVWLVSQYPSAVTAKMLQQDTGVSKATARKMIFWIETRLPGQQTISFEDALKRCLDAVG